MKKQEQSISPEVMKEFSDRYITKNTTNADVFGMIRGMSEASAGNNTKLTNIGSMYWYLIETRNMKKDMKYEK